MATPIYYTKPVADICLTCTRPECDHGPGCPFVGERNTDSVIVPAEVREEAWAMWREWHRAKGRAE